MKIVAVFLACIVASQAAVFNIPDYEYWCNQNFCVVPHQSYYSYKVNFNQAWCQGHFYRGILCEFPKCFVPKGCEAEENAAGRISEIEQRLAHVRQQIYGELMQGQEQWIKMLMDLNHQYVCTFRDYYQHATNCAYSELEGRLKQYSDELEGYKQQGIARYNGNVHEIMQRIEQYHCHLVDQFKGCLQKRQHQIGGIHGKMGERAQHYVNVYKEKLDHLRTKKVTYVRHTFATIYKGKAMPSEFEDVIKQWEEEMVRYDQTLVQGFYTKVMQAAQMIEKDYRCTYVCYFRNGCYSIGRKQSKCGDLPVAPKCNFNFSHVGAFSAEWNGVAYKTLKTCSKKEQESGGEFHPEKYEEEIHRKCNVYTQELAYKYRSWKNQVEEWCHFAITGLEELIVCKMPKGHNGGQPTQAEIEHFHHLLRVQAKEWIDLHQHKMLHQIECVHERVHVRILQWKSHADQMIHTVKSNFNRCISSRQSKIDAYIKGLYTKRTHQRAAIIKTLTHRAHCHLVCFDKFFCSVFGENPSSQIVLNLRTHYHECVDTKVKKIIEKFDYFHHYYEPRLIMHYCCCFKCNAKFTCPSFRLMAKWNFCPPSLDSCTFRC